MNARNRSGHPEDPDHGSQGGNFGLKGEEMRHWGVHQPAGRLVDLAGFIAVLLGSLVTIMTGEISADALATAAYLTSMYGAWRAGATRYQIGCRCHHRGPELPEDSPT